MDLYPAIDLRAGRVVRLLQGEADRETAYPTDPVAQAEQFLAEGAGWLHVVDLDRAFGTGDNLEVIGRIARAVGRRARIQVGGGVRTLAALAEVLGLGVTRAVIGTAAVRDPALVRDALTRYGAGQVAVGLDARNRKIAIRGWVETTNEDVADLATRVHTDGIRTVIYTDVGRDGMLAGPDIEGAVALGRLGLEVIVSGGVSSLEDLARAREAGLPGAIVGRALYEGRFTVRQALG